MLKRTLIVLGASVIAAGCGGGGGGGGGGSGENQAVSAITLNGIAATGGAIQSGNVEAKCVSGSGSSKTGEDGSYSVSISNGVMPCLLKATDPFTQTDYYSAAESGATKANITPLSHLVVANALGGSPSTAFVNFDGTLQTKITAARLRSATEVIHAATAALGSDANLTGVDLLKDNFKPATPESAGDSIDKKIDALMLALAASNKRIADLEQQIGAASSTNAASTAVLNSIGTAKNTLQNCPYARSTTIWVLDMFGSEPIQYSVDFTAMTFKRLSTQSIYGITPKSEKCAFTANIDGSPIEFRVSQGGNAAWVSPTNFGVAVPAQTFWDIRGSAASGSYASLFYLVQKANRSSRTAVPVKIQIKPGGDVDMFICDLFKDSPDCNESVQDTTDDQVSCTQSQNGSFSCSSPGGDRMTGVLYATGNQVTLLLSFSEFKADNGTRYGGLVVATKANAIRLPTVGQTYPESWTARIASGTNTVTSLTSLSRKVTSVSASTQSFTSIIEGQPSSELTSKINMPMIGMRYTVGPATKSVRLIGNGGWSFNIGNSPNQSTLWDAWNVHVE